MQTKWWCRLLDLMAVQWRKYRAFWWWLVVCLGAGVVFGIVTVVVTGIGVDEINYRLIDANLRNATMINSSVGAFIWQRILSLLLPMVVVWVFAWLSNWTALAIFPVVLMHGYWLAVAVWWTFFYYGWTALLLLVFYTLWLLLVAVILLVGLLWAWQCGAKLRVTKQITSQFWGNLCRGVLVMLGVAVLLGIFEYLVFWTVLGKIVYKPL